MDVGDILLKVLDVANPLAGAAAEFVASKMGLSDKSADAVRNAVSAMGQDPAQAVQLKKIAADLQDHLAQYNIQLQTEQLKAQSADVVAVNQTLTAEAKGDSWLQKNHHAIECLLTVGLVIAIYFVLPLAKIAPPTIPSEAFIMLGGVLGVTAWNTSKSKVQ